MRGHHQRVCVTYPAIANHPLLNIVICSFPWQVAFLLKKKKEKESCHDNLI